MKKNLFLKLCVFAVIGSLLTFTACKDYDDDIKNLQNQVTEINKNIDAIKAAIENGDVIESVTSTAEGVVIKTKKGEYKITNGKSGSTVTIGENGNWFIDDTDTGKASKGADGKDGVDGKPGADGKDGVYYTPGEDGYWYVVEGETKTKTDQRWLGSVEGGLTAVLEDGAILLYGVEGVEGPIAIGGAGINTLTLIPDFVADEGGSLPLIDFSPLVTKCGEISPSVTVRYKVNKNATEASIDKEGIHFLYNNPTVRSSAINAKAEFVSLANGVLTVKADINTAHLEDGSSNKIDQVMLVVPTTTGDEVHSDWAKVTANALNPIALVRVPAIQEGIVWSQYKLVEKAVDAKALATKPTKHVTVVDLAYDETLDLLEVVNTMMVGTPWANFDIERYGLSYAFDLKDENGNTIVYELGTNKTDQQKFINLVGSEISTRVYDIDGSNPASIDRTPIVHVYLKSNDSAIKCNVLDGFIKINIVEAKVEPVPPVTFDGEVEAGCDAYKLVVGTQEMNENFYAAAKLSKEKFHQFYVFDPMASEPNGIGTISQVVDPEDTQSYNLVWTVSADDLWANVGKTITKSGSYTYGSNVINVKFTAKVTQPTYVGPKRVDNQWFNNYSYMKFNVAVPASGDTNPANATFDTNINDGFLTAADKLLDLPAQYSYEYFFAPVAEQPVKSVDGITISVSADGKELIATKGTTVETVATILAQAAGTGDILSYNQTSVLGKHLLNKAPEYMKARLNLKVYLNCTGSTTVKEVVLKNGAGQFNVHFLRPVNVEGKSAEHFVDGVDCGAKGSVLNLTDVVRLSDWRNYAKNTTDYYFDPNHENYYDYYDVSSITVNIDDIKLKGLKVDGVEHEEVLSTMNIEVLAPATGSVYGSLQYCNSGSNLAEEFSLMVPVTVTYKWGEVETIVEVPVKPTSTLRSAK